MTWELYNELLRFYYQLFLEHSELHSLGKQKLLRALEQLSIVGRDKRPVEQPLPFKGVPLYFRRAAINAALAAGKSYLAREGQKQPTEAFEAGVTLYKGNYKDLDSHSIRIKVWNGERWLWIRCRLSGNVIKEGDVCLSPRMVFCDERIELHVPVRQPVPDGRTLRFLRGGRDYAHRCWRIQEKIRISQESVGRRRGSNDNKKYWKKLKQISDDMAHQVSRQIVDFCVETGAGVIVLPKYSETFTKYVMASVGNWSPLHLNYQIRSQLKYKAWQSGILVLESEASDIKRYCAACGGVVHSQGEQFVCENGHRGNRRINAAVNLGRKTRESLSEHLSCNKQNG